MVKHTTYKGYRINQIRRACVVVYHAGTRYDFKSLASARNFINILTQE